MQLGKLCQNVEDLGRAYASSFGLHLVMRKYCPWVGLSGGLQARFIHRRGPGVRGWVGVEAPQGRQVESASLARESHAVRVSLLLGDAADPMFAGVVDRHPIAASDGQATGVRNHA